MKLMSFVQGCSSERSTGTAVEANFTTQARESSDQGRSVNGTQNVTPHGSAAINRG
jgi:hypothetical protein